MGVQDFTPEVQDAIYRHQDEAQTRRLYAYARGSGFGSINIDLVYGLPRQSVETFTRTLESVVEMRPERIAVYSYAHIPSLRPNQARINSDDLPSREVKAACFGMAVETFLDAGYVQIGMDHFALPSDDLAVAVRRGTLHRNFMGYTTRQAADLLACGVSAIGEVQGAFAQNTKSLATYYAALDAGRLPIERGYVLDGDDRLRRHVIMQLMCNFRVDRREVERRFDVTFGEYFRLELEELEAEDGPVAQGFLEIRPDRLAVLPDGRFFVRNICMAFDRHLRRRRMTDDPPPFSRTV
jgi:oxygen-independent coproporphyrinogen III oxidase